MMKWLGEIIGVRKIHAFLKNCDQANKNFRLLIGEIILFRGLIEQEYRFSNFKNLSLTDSTDNLNGFGHDDNLLPIKINDTDKETKIQGSCRFGSLKLLQLNLFHMIFVPVDDQHGGDQAFGIVGFQVEEVFFCPYCYC